MTTKRLSDWDRQQIIDGYKRKLRRCLHNKQFPIKKDDLETWGISLLDPVIYDKWKYLREHVPDMVKDFSYFHSTFTISDDNYVYKVKGYKVPLPYDDIVVPHDHPTHPEVLAWVQWYDDMELRRASAVTWLHKCVAHCHSIGQVKRVLPEEILRFSPDHMLKTLKDAERQSRIPAGFNIDEEKMKNLADTLALASISPEDEPDVDVTVTYKTVLSKA
jgi:hypothetical protein